MNEMKNYKSRYAAEELKSNSLPLVSIIINNYKGTRKLEKCLSSIIRSECPKTEIVVVDCLTKGIMGWIEEKYPYVKITHFDYDVGPPSQFNAGLEITNPNSKYIIFMDNDIEVEKGWLQPLIEVMERNLAVGAAQPKILRGDSRKEVDSVGCFLDPIGYPYRSGFSLRGMNEVKSQNDTSIFYAETATMILRRDVLNALQEPREPFDSDYFIHWHDIDLSWKIWLAGYKVVVVLDSTVYHERGVSGGLSKLSSKHIFINTRNKITTLVKNYSLRNLIKYSPLLLIFELARVTALLNRRPDHSLSIIAGYVWTFRNLKSIWRKRLKVQRFIRRVPDSHILNHFIRLSPLRLYRDFHLHYDLASSGECSQ